MNSFLLTVLNIIYAHEAVVLPRQGHYLPYSSTPKYDYTQPMKSVVFS